MYGTAKDPMLSFENSGNTYAPKAKTKTLMITPGYWISMKLISEAYLLTFIAFKVLATLISCSLGAWKLIY